MAVIDVSKEVLREVEIKGHMALFTSRRVGKSTIPERIYLSWNIWRPMGRSRNGSLLRWKLIRFMDENEVFFLLSEKEADVLLGYLDGHSFLGKGREAVPQGSALCA